MVKSNVVSTSLKYFVYVTICLSSLVSTIDACTCAARPPVCYLYPETEAVFVGEVESVSNDPNVFPDKVKIKVVENIKGMPFDFANTWNHMTSCSFSYSKGEKFLFFAGVDKKDDTFFSAGLCSGTTRYSNELAELSFVRDLKLGRSPSMIWVTASTSNDSPFEGLEAEVIKPRLNLRAKSDKNGDLRIKVTSPGKYLVRIWFPRGKEWASQQTGGPEEFFKQLGMFRRFGKTRKGSFRDFEVNVEEKKCGWLNMPLYNKSDS